jgi:hypothetical protein
MTGEVFDSALERETPKREPSLLDRVAEVFCCGPEGCESIFDSGKCKVNDKHRRCAMAAIAMLASVETKRKREGTQAFP